MKLKPEQLKQLSQLAIEAAREAARFISAYAQKDLKVERKAGGESLAAQVVTEVDRLSQDVILKKLRTTLQEYDLGLLTEESEDDGSRLVKDYFWCIDPLDGTLPFTEKRPGYAVSIALVSKEGIPQIGVVVNPVDQNLYHAVKGVGAFKNEVKVKIEDFNRSQDIFTLVCDKQIFEYDLPEHVKNDFKEKISEMGYPNLNIIDPGGAVMSAIYVLENAPAYFFKLPKKTQGGGCLWDYAATACIFEELCASVSDYNGDRLDLNRKESPFMNERGVLYCS